MNGLLIERLRCLLRGHTWVWRCNDAHVPGYECVSCCTWVRRLF